MSSPGGTPAIGERVVPERLLAVVARDVLQGDLTAFIEQGFTALLAYRAALPVALPNEATPEWPVLAEYHGPLWAEVRALVELCAAVGPGAAAAPGIELRVEPTHREAFVPVTKAELRFPEILDVYAALAGWVADRGHLVSSLVPRELYVRDVRTAGLGDHVCDVAIPFVPAP